MFVVKDDETKAYVYDAINDHLFGLDMKNLENLVCFSCVKCFTS